MMKFLKAWLLLFLIFETGCTPINTSSTNFSDQTIQPTSITIRTKMPNNTEIPVENEPLTPTPIIPDQNRVHLWINDLVINKVKNEIIPSDQLIFTEDDQEADIKIDLIDENDALDEIYTYYFVLSTPFDSLIKNISLNALTNFWESPNSDEYLVWVNDKDLFLIEKILGQLKNKNILVSDEEPELCQTQPCVRIAGFEMLSPTWHVVTLDNDSIFDRSNDLSNYPLKIRVGINKKDKETEEFNSVNQINFYHQANFDPEKLSVVMLTGTTALSRGIAFQMEKNGVLFPEENIGGILKKADILHISHEIPMFSGCPPAVPLREEMRFCSAPYYIQLFQDLGVDVVELTGNHLLDWGPDAFLETLTLYKNYQFQTYGAGVSISQAEQPLLVEDHGNKFVFLGCNLSGPDNVWVNNDRPGVLKCDIEKMVNQVQKYRAMGYLPIVTFQHFEVDDFDPITLLKQDFWAVAEAGAVIVSGSQAHFPQGFDFVGESFVDYGLGNMFFDQMANWYRKATIDVHYFYDGQYINTQLISIINENQGQPREMTEEEEKKFLTTMFEHSFYYEK